MRLSATRLFECKFCSLAFCAFPRCWNDFPSDFKPSPYFHFIRLYNLFKYLFFIYWLYNKISISFFLNGTVFFHIYSVCLAQTLMYRHAAIRIRQLLSCSHFLSNAYLFHITHSLKIIKRGSPNSVSSALQTSLRPQ